MAACWRMTGKGAIVSPRIRIYRTHLPLPAGVQCYAIAATKRQADGDSGLDLLGDGFVAVNSALGRHSKS